MVQGTPIPASCPLTSTLVLWHGCHCTDTPIKTHTQINKCQIIEKDEGSVWKVINSVNSNVEAMWGSSIGLFYNFG